MLEHLRGIFHPSSAQNRRKDAAAHAMRKEQDDPNSPAKRYMAAVTNICNHYHVCEDLELTEGETRFFHRRAAEALGRTLLYPHEIVFSAQERGLKNYLKTTYLRDAIWEPSRSVDPENIATFTTYQRVLNNAAFQFIEAGFSQLPYNGSLQNIVINIWNDTSDRYLPEDAKRQTQAALALLNKPEYKNNYTLTFPLTRNKVVIKEYREKSTQQL